MELAPDDKLLTPKEVAVTFGVDVKTVGEWEKKKKLKAIRTPGGHRRYLESEVNAYLNPPPETGPEADPEA